MEKVFVSISSKSQFLLNILSQHNMSSKHAKFCLKVVINKQKTKVLFAEANSDFADVLISFLTLPLGRIVRVLEEHYGDKAPVLGSLTTLYKGLVNLDVAHFWTEGYKQMLINPRTSFSDECRKLKLDISDSQPVRYFACKDRHCTRSGQRDTSMYYDVARCDCGKPMTREIRSKDVSECNTGDGGAFIVDGVSFIISDELLVLPNVVGFQILSKLGITEADWGEVLNVAFGFGEIMDLLKGSHLSRTPLTDTILNKSRINFTWPSDPLKLLPKVEKEAATDFDTISLKVIVQKSTNKLLFAQADEDFIDFLLSLLAIPLGGVECLMNGSSSVTNIDNLYRSVANLIDAKYFKSADAKNRLIEPKLAYGYHSQNCILPLKEEYVSNVSVFGDHCTPVPRILAGPCNMKFLKGNGSYVKRPSTYMVSDDLSVTPLCMMSYLSNLTALGIPFSDVTETVLHVGLEEALSILKASLVSKSALSNGLNHLLMKRKRPKIEQ